MRALVTTGDPDSPIALTETTEPVAAADQALVAVSTSSLNRGEVMRLARSDAGVYPGQDLTGTVLRQAADGSGPPAGTRVVGHALSGAWAERVAVPTTGLAVLPETVDGDQAATLPLAGLTALRLIRRIGGRLVGGRVLLTSAAGGVGHLFIEMASGIGASITAVTSDASRGPRLIELGAKDVVATTAEASGPYDVVLESIGGASFEAAYHAVTADGLIVWMGQSSLEPGTLRFFDRVGPGINPTIQRFSYWPDVRTDGEDLSTLAGLVAAGRIHPEIGRVFDWNDAASAIGEYRSRAVAGNVVLRIS